MRSLLLSLLIFCSAQIAFAQMVPAPGQKRAIEVTLAYYRGVGITNLEKFNLLVGNSCVLAQRPMFPVNEQSILVRNPTLAHLAAARILELRDEKCIATLEAQARELKLPVMVDMREIGEIKLAQVEKASAPDTYEKLQWGLQNIGKNQSIDLETLKNHQIQGVTGQDIGIKNVKPVVGTKVRVAVIDTGIDAKHPDLVNKIVTIESECQALAKFRACTDEAKKLPKKPEKDKAVKACHKTWFDLKNPEVDQDKNGYPLDCHGWNLVSGPHAAERPNPVAEVSGISGDPFTEDPHGHGTHVAGIIAAEAQNGIGIRGVSTNVEILPIKIPANPNEPIKISQVVDPSEKAVMEKIQKLWGDGKPKQFYADLIARAIIYAINSKAQIVSLSLGWDFGRDSKFMRSMVELAQASGIVFVAAAGNDSTKALMRPCSYSGVICVGSHGPDGAISHFSNYGSGVDFVAPGVRILSTYPLDTRDVAPIRFYSQKGYEYVTGTSQSTPFVTGVMAELLSRGFSSDEAYARLMLKTKKPLAPLEIVEFIPEESDQRSDKLLPSLFEREKFVLGGTLDFFSALNAEPAPLILPKNKERTEILWNRKSSVLNWKVQLKNFWKDIEAKDVQVKVSIAQAARGVHRVQIQGYEVEGLSGTWKQGQEKNLSILVNMGNDPFFTRASGDLEVKVEIVTPFQNRFAILEADIVVPITPMAELDQDMNAISIQGEMPANPSIRWMPISQNLDNYEGRDYFLRGYEIKKENDKDQVYWNFWLVHQSNNLQNSYQVSKVFQTKAESTNPKIRFEQFTFRLDDNGDGKPEYLLGIYDDYTEQGKFSPVLLYFFDQDMNLIEFKKYDPKDAPMPWQPHWVRINGKTRPIWVGPGRDLEKKWTLGEIRDNPHMMEDYKSRLYYLNENYELKMLKSDKDNKDFKIVDVLHSSREMARSGVINLLLSHNLGKDLSPEFKNEYAIVKFENGKLGDKKMLDYSKNGSGYRDLINTRVSQIYSLDYELDHIKGTYWFARSGKYAQSVSTLFNKGLEYHGYLLNPVREKVDAALWTRASFAGEKIKGSFVYTNSQIQFHDLKTLAVVHRSMERYTFLAGPLIENTISPIVVGDRNLKTKLPGLFNPEGAKLTPSTKIIVPAYDGNDLVELTAPARLRFRGESGCRPLDNPVWGGVEAAAYLDYECRDGKASSHIKRIKLDY